jgi:hypothetical protein
VSFLILVRRVFIVDVNVLRAFVVTILLDYIKSRLVIRSKIERAEVVTNISKLAK